MNAECSSIFEIIKIALPVVKCDCDKYTWWKVWEIIGFIEQKNMDFIEFGLPRILGSNRILEFYQFLNPCRFTNSYPILVSPKDSESSDPTVP